MRASSTLPFALAAALLAGAGCYNLPTVDPGPRWIDQFNRDPRNPGQLGTPSWAVFSPWTCGTSPLDQPDGGQPAVDAGPMDGGIDAGAGAACQAGPGDNADYHDDPSGLMAPFQFADSANNLEFAVSTTTVSGGTVDFTGFKQLVFSAKLKSASPSSGTLPATTSFHVELDCTRNSTDPAATQTINNLQIDNPTWQVFRPELNQFIVTLTSGNQACLSIVDGIRFVVVPGDNDQPLVSGTLSLDNVSLQN
jgi:hypothetical protein